MKATGHTEEIILGKAATCMESGLSDGKICAVCKTVITPQAEIAKLPHDFAKNWSYDADGHYHVCMNKCGTKNEIVKHTSSGPATEDAAEVCTICGYMISPALDHYESERAQDAVYNIVTEGKMIKLSQEEVGKESVYLTLYKKEQ